MKLSLVPIGIQFSYEIKGNSSQKVLFSNELFGNTNYSKFSQYKYKRKGLLSKISFIRISNSVIVVKREDAEKVRKFLKGKTKFSENPIVLNHKQAKKLGVEQHKDWKFYWEELIGKGDLIFTVDF